MRYDMNVSFSDDQTNRTDMLNRLSEKVDKKLDAAEVEREVVDFNQPGGDIYNIENEITNINEGGLFDEEQALQDFLSALQS